MGAGRSVARRERAAASQEGRARKGQQAYSEARADIRTGDVLLFRGTSALSRVIQWGSRSVYSHAGFAALWGGRVMVFQSTGRGAEVLPLSTAVGSYDGRVDLYRLAEGARAAVREEALVAAGIALLGRRYATWPLLGLMWRMAQGRFRGRKDAGKDPLEVFCSQYVSHCFRAAGLDLVPDTDDASTSPGDLSLSAHLTMEAVLRDDTGTRARRSHVEGRLVALPTPPPR
jgi:hypothetical protein